MDQLQHGQNTSTPTNYSYTLLRDQDAVCPMLQPSAPTQPIYQQPTPVLPQPPPPPQSGVQYHHLQPYPTPQLVLGQPQQPRLMSRQKTTRYTDTSTRLPKYAFMTSVVATVIFTALCWLPGYICLVPAVIISMVAITKKEANRLKEAKRYSIISLILVLIFAISYPILVTGVILAIVYGYLCDYLPKAAQHNSIYYTYQKPYICG